MSQCVGVVLAGGEGKRLGRSKGELQLGKSKLAERAATVLWPFCSSVLISIRPGADNPAPRFASVEDLPPAGRGPLAGIHAAYESTGEADLLVLACDYPGVEGELLRGLLEGARTKDDLVILTDGSGRDHPLVGLWRRSAEPRVREMLEHGYYKVRSIFPEVELRRLRPTDFPGLDLEQALLNINHPADLERL